MHRYRCGRDPVDLRQLNLEPVIPPKSNRKVTIRYRKRLSRQCNCIERWLDQLKINRAGNRTSTGAADCKTHDTLINLPEQAAGVVDPI
jgi:hypothetical protein